MTPVEVVQLRVHHMIDVDIVSLVSTDYTYGTQHAHCEPRMGRTAPITDYDEQCPLCPAAGPPTKASVRSQDPANGDTTPEDEAVDLVWIACSRCNSWFHSCCILLADPAVRETVPQGVRNEVETSHKDETPFFDWTIWINKW